MNTKFIIYNFQEIQEEVEILLHKAGSGLSHEQFYKSVQHLYHHLNIAWNARSTEPGVVFDLDDPRMDLWKEFPKDLTLI